MADNYLCIHGHFYQAPRGNPFADDELPDEPGAAPHRNLTEKVTETCYKANAVLGNLDLMSFNFGATLARWLQANATPVHERILAAERTYREVWGVSNALAQPLHHTIMPLNPARDKALQVRWGLTAYEHRFGHPAEGMWLPEMAVDLETLQVLHDHGLKFTLLSQGQVQGADQGAGPYWVKLPSGDRLAVYVRDDAHSNQLAYGVHTLGGAGRWARNTLAPLRRSSGRLLLLALNGETFGHHYPGEEHFLHWLLAYEGLSAGYEITTLARDLQTHAPVKEIEVKEYTAWSCPHGLARWTVGCDCTPGQNRWKGALRRALDNLASRLDEAYHDYVRDLGTDPWALRAAFYRVRLGQLTEAQLLSQAGLDGVDEARARTVMALLTAQFHRQRMYVSSSFYVEDLDQPEPRYAIANAVRAILLEAPAAAEDFLPDFRRDLAQAVSGKSGVTGAQIMDQVLAAVGEAKAE